MHWPARLAWICLIAFAWDAKGAESSCPSIEGANRRPVFDATALLPGRFTYRLSRNGEVLGEAVIEIRPHGDAYRLSMNAPDVGQDWESIVTRSFEPMTAHLSMRGGQRDYVMDLHYAGRHVTGTERDGATTRKVDVSTSGIVIDQRVDWASMLALKAPPGEKIAVDVFDASTGVSQMVGSVAESGTRLDYTICKRGHVETYTVFTTKETPRVMLREDMPDGLVSELILRE